jgi:hypothetical protein
LRCVSEPVKEECAAPPAIERDGLGACDERRRLGARVDAVGHSFHDARFHADALVPVMMPNVRRLVASNAVVDLGAPAVNAALEVRYAGKAGSLQPGDCCRAARSVVTIDEDFPSGIECGQLALELSQRYQPRTGKMPDFKLPSFAHVEHLGVTR